MKGRIRYLVLLAAVALMSPVSGSAEQPPGMAAADMRAPDTVVWTARAPAVPRMSSRPGVMVPTIEAGVERPGSSEMTKEDGMEFQAPADQGTFLRPTWDRGFWVMPPGGLTRFLLPAPGFINPVETLAADPVIVDSG